MKLLMGKNGDEKLKSSFEILYSLVIKILIRYFATPDNH